MRLKLKEGSRPRRCCCVFCDPCLSKSMERHSEDGRVVGGGRAFLDCQKTILQLFLYDSLNTVRQSNEESQTYITRQRLKANVCVFVCVTAAVCGVCFEGTSAATLHSQEPLPVQGVVCGQLHLLWVPDVHTHPSQHHLSGHAGESLTHIHKMGNGQSGL